MHSVYHRLLENRFRFCFAVFKDIKSNYNISFQITVMPKILSSFQQANATGTLNSALEDEVFASS